MTTDSTLNLSAIKRRLADATPGPWRWAEDEFNDRIAPRNSRGTRKPAPGYTMGDTYLLLLLGRVHHDVSHLAPQQRDQYDYERISALRRRDVRTPFVEGVRPSPADADFIANAWQDIHDLLREVERLQGLIDDGANR